MSLRGEGRRAARTRLPGFIRLLRRREGLAGLWTFQAAVINRGHDVIVSRAIGEAGIGEAGGGGGATTVSLGGDGIVSTGSSNGAMPHVPVFGFGNTAFNALYQSGYSSKLT